MATVWDLKLSNLDFPTDRLTVRQLRDLEPQLDRDEDHPLNHTQIGETMSLERMFAKTVFARLIGDVEYMMHTAATYPEEEQITDLRRLYVVHELAGGPEQAKELIRSIERQVTQVVNRGR